MSDMPMQRSAAAPDQVETPTIVADSIVAGPDQRETPEWLAAKQRQANGGKSEDADAAFSDLEKEMQALKGMSEI